MQDKTMTRREVLGAAASATAAAALAAPAAAYAQDATKPIGVALVGGAHIHTPQYVGALKSRAGVKVKYTWDHDAARADKRAKEVGSKTTADLKEIWDDPEIAAVVICSETNRHHDLVLEAAHAKKHMFVEKPLGITAKESFAMAEAIEKANLLFTTGYFMRTDPQHLFLKSQVEAGNFGKITRIRGSNCHSGSLGGWFDGEYRWMADPKIAGVGAFGDLGTHSLDIMMWLLGGVESATADINIVTNRYAGCDESGEALLKFQNGAIGTLAAGWVDIANPVTLEISGTEGFASIVKGRLDFRSNKVKDAQTNLPSGPPPPIEQFLNALEGKPHDSLVKPSEAAMRVAVMEAAYKGAHTQSWVKVSQA
ncbi:MAG TPA: Gfo/Idh/MocA family oxidoreductase [Chthonomonadaceae bacterium]|nr:Gfo/Idh/MocA family oxidoreductase [Chthonomonadaceae bacterium]